MKHTFLLLLLAFVGCLGMQADQLVSGESYRICSLDGQTAISNGGSSANNVILSMSPINLDDEGQVWELTQNGDYWQIKSAVGDVCADNPSESHANWGNQLLQWKTSGGNNQKWTFKEADNGSYYLIPFESKDMSKGYGYDDTGKLTFQSAGGDHTRFVLKKVAGQLEPLHVNGYYAIQAVSCYPDFYYKADGRFLKVNDKGVSSLSTSYTYEESRLLLSTDEAGHVFVQLPQQGVYLYRTSSGCRTAAIDDESHKANAVFMFYGKQDELTSETLFAFGHGESEPTNENSSISMWYPNVGGSALTVARRAVGQGYAFRLVPLPAESDVELLAQVVSEATAALEGLGDEAAAALQAAIATAQAELDYPYLTKKDVVRDVASLREAVKTAQEASAAKAQPATGISQAEQTARPALQVEGGIIRVNGAQVVRIYNAAGQLQNPAQRLHPGTYVVTADGYSFKVTL